MAIVRTFRGYHPLPREDDRKWTSLAIYEEATPAEEFDTQIDTQPVPDYPDPAAPPLINFTTDDATMESAWYRVQFRDDFGGHSWTAPEAITGSGVFLPPAAMVVRDRSPLLQKRYPDGQEEALREAVLDATALVESLTCRSAQVSTGSAGLDRIGMRAVILKTEELSGASTAKGRAGQLSELRLRSFSAGPYSETYFGPDDAAKIQALSPDPRLHEALWAFATEECRAKWLGIWTGEYAPFGGVEAFNYRYQPPLRGY